MCVLLCACHWVISTLCPSAVKDRCSAGQVVTARGSAGLLWCPVGEHAGHPYGAAACLRLYSHTFWPNGLTEPTSVHARLRSARSGECLCTWNPYLWEQFMSLFFPFVFYNSCYRMSELLSVYRWSHFVYLCKIQMPWCRGTHLKSCSTFSHLQHAW